MGEVQLWQSDRLGADRDTMAHYKADLYDFYAQVGSVPNYG